MELPPLVPVTGWKVTLAVCDSGIEEDLEEGDGTNAGEAEAAGRLFGSGRVMLSYTGATARLVSPTCT